MSQSYMLLHLNCSQFVVPIVLGGLSKQDYEKLAPPDSFIHVDDFNTSLDLAKYVNFLNDNPQEYNKYQDWREKYSGMHQILLFLLQQKIHISVLNEHGYFGAPILHYCRLCEALNFNSLDGQVFKDLDSFWNTERDCRKTRY